MNGWTEQMDAELVRLYNAGISFRLCAPEISSRCAVSVSRNAVIGRAHRLGLRRGPDSKKPKSARTSSRPRVHRARRVEPAHELLEDDRPALRCVEVAPLEIDLLSLTDAVCHYPSENAPFTYCGHLAKEGSPYCGPHHAICHNHTPNLRKPFATRRGDRVSRFSTVADYEVA